MRITAIADDDVALSTVTAVAAKSGHAGTTVENNATRTAGQSDSRLAAVEMGFAAVGLKRGVYPEGNSTGPKGVEGNRGKTAGIGRLISSVPTHCVNRC